MVEKIGVWFAKGAEVLLLSFLLVPISGTIQPVVLGALSPKVKWLECASFHSIPSSAEGHEILELYHDSPAEFLMSSLIQQLMTPASKFNPVTCLDGVGG